MLSAIEGMKDVQSLGSEIDRYIVPMTVAILVLCSQYSRAAPASVATFFGPMMTSGSSPSRCRADLHRRQSERAALLSTQFYGIAFLAGNGILGLVTLGAVFLAVTGAEALYADLGHFGRAPIQPPGSSWSSRR